MDLNPALYLFPVPIGDTTPLEVLPARNIEILRQVRHFVVEDARSARRFLKACERDIDLQQVQMVELNRHTPAEEVASMLAPLEQGHSMGVISESGCPAVADPGADVVAIAQKKGMRVVPLVGPSSILMSLMGSGFNGQNFAFNGYLPIDAQQRAAKIKEMERRIRKERQTQIFIETPYRNAKLAAWLSQNLGADIMMCIASDITGPDESIITLPAHKWRAKAEDLPKKPAIYLLYS